MKTKIVFLCVLGASLLAVSLSQAAELCRSTRVDFKVGFMDRAQANTTISPVGVVTNSYESSGGLASMGLGVKIRDGFWGDFSIGVRGLEVSSEVRNLTTFNHAVALMPFMVGFRAYPLYREETGFQPYLFAAGGPIIGAEASERVGYVTVVESHSETTMGANVGGGVDLLLTNWFAFEFSGGYTFMNDFAKPLGGETNFNGWDASLGLCFFFGKR